MKQLLAAILILGFFSCTKGDFPMATSCPPPTNLTVKDIYKNGATFVWDAVTPAPDMGYWWKIIRVSDNVEVLRNAGHDTYNLVTGNKYEVYIYALQGEILPNTQYKFQLAAQCHYPDNVSEFKTILFTTAP